MCCIKSKYTERLVKCEPYRVCRRVNILRDYPDDKTKLYPR
ncbi:glycosyltransferase, partial [Acinetobacter pittii]